MFARICLLLSLLNICSFSFEGKIVAIADGDTLTVLSPTTHQQIEVRLSGIDTPEKSQAFGLNAKKALSAKVFGKTIEVKSSGKDRYGRTIGDIYLGKRWINLEMVSEGLAWPYKQYSKDTQLANAEVVARRARRGLWADSDPVPPWEFRRGGKVSNKSSKKQAPITGYWLNTSSGTRHNSNCRHYKNTKRGKPCGESAGKPCGMCGG